MVLAEGSLRATQYSGMIEAGEMDFTGFARAYISNPDLATRLANGWPIAQPDMNTTYCMGAEGYTDYPRWGEGESEAFVRGLKQHDDSDKLLLEINV